MFSDDKIDTLLRETHTDHREKYPDLYIEHYLEQYRIYIHVFNSTAERRQKSNEFFLGINTAIMAVLGYIETKGLAESSVIFTVVPFIGIIICNSWRQMILSYRQLARAKFKVIHRLETKLPIALFETEWDLLGRGKDSKKYYPVSRVEKNVPLIFILLYLVIFFAYSPIATTIMPFLAHVK